MTLRPIIKKRPHAGRPSSNPKKANFRTSPLYAKLIKAFPQFCKDEDGKTNLNISDLADYIGYHRYALYRWLGGQAMRPKAASTLVEKSNGALKLEDLLAHVF